MTGLPCSHSAEHHFSCVGSEESRAKLCCQEGKAALTNGLEQALTAVAKLVASSRWKVLCKAALSEHLTREKVEFSHSFVRESVFLLSVQRRAKTRGGECNWSIGSYFLGWNTTVNSYMTPHILL